MKYIKTFEQFINEGKSSSEIYEKIKSDFLKSSVKVTGINESNIDALSKCFIVKEGKLYVDLNNASLEDGVVDALKEMFESLLQRDSIKSSVQFNNNQNSWCIWENSIETNESVVNEEFGKGNPIDGVLDFINRYGYANGTATVSGNKFIFKDGNPVEIKVEWGGHNDEDTMEVVMQFIKDVEKLFGSMSKKFYFYEPDSEKKYSIKDFIKYNQDFIEELLNETR